MPTITKIKPQKRKDRVNIYLDGKFAFGLDLEAAVKEKLKVGKELREEEVEELIRKNEFGKLMDKALRFLEVRPRSEREVRTRLQKKLKVKDLKFKSGLVEEVVGKLRKMGHLGDRKFAAWWVEQRVRFRPRGKLMLKKELYQKGVKREIIEEVLEEVDEKALGIKLVKKKLSRLSGLKQEEKRKKLEGYLRRRGFSFEIMAEVIDTAGFSQ